jgi:hypothetical protein
MRRFSRTILDINQTASISMADTMKPIKIIKPLLMAFLYKNHRNIVFIAIA